MSVSRRAFFGAATLPLAAKVTRPAPVIAITNKVLGFEGWIPDEPPSGAFFGIDRSVETDITRTLRYAIEHMGERPYWEPIDWRQVFDG